MPTPDQWSLAKAVLGAERQVLTRIEHGGMHVSELELRYQLEHKDEHVLALAPELLDVLAALEQRALIESELCFRLTPRGHQRLAQLRDG
jgi:hypothetical protein